MLYVRRILENLLLVCFSRWGKLFSFRRQAGAPKVGTCQEKTEHVLDGGFCDPLLIEGQAWLDEVSSLSEVDRIILSEGANLASLMRSRAIDLASSKGTEFSPDIERLFFMAAKIALISFDEGSDYLEQFEQDVDYHRRFQSPYYNDFGKTRALVKDWDAFKRLRRSLHAGRPQ